MWIFIKKMLGILFYEIVIGVKKQFSKDRKEREIITLNRIVLRNKHFHQ